MKIGYGIGKVTGTEYSPEYSLIDVVYDYPSIKQHEAKGLVGHKRPFYNFVQALTRNALFRKEVLSLRKELGIPTDGLSFKKYQTLNTLIGKDKTNGINVAQMFLGRNELSHNFTYPNELDKCLYDIVFYGLVSPFSAIQSAIAWNSSAWEPTGYIEINIFAPVTKNALHRFIDENWKVLESEIKNLDKKPTADFSLISDRDFEIVTLKDEQKLTFPKITDRIYKKYGNDDSDYKINDDSVKTAYARTKKKITDIFTPKK